MKNYTKFMPPFSTLSIGLIVCLLTLPAFAQDSTEEELGIGSVIYFEGSVKGTLDQKYWLPLEIGQKIKRDHRLKTGDMAMLEIKWVNGATTTLSANAEHDALELYENSQAGGKAKEAPVWGKLSQMFNEEAEKKGQEEGGIRRSMAEVRAKPGRNEFYWKEAPQVTFEQASEEYLARKYRSASLLLQQFIDQQPRHPQTPRARFALAHCFVELNNIPGAVEELKQFVERYPNHELTEQASFLLDDLEE